MPNALRGPIPNALRGPIPNALRGPITNPSASLGPITKDCQSL
ncbi:MULTISPECIES: hypothetical protein [unclassified Tychonema]|nr:MULTISPECIES: hypothetical protein [unclassified Tychonema]